MKYWSEMTHEEKLTIVKESAEAYRRVTGLAQCTHTDGEYSATATKEKTTVLYKGEEVSA